jgi:hypothetical protein
MEARTCETVSNWQCPSFKSVGVTHELAPLAEIFKQRVFISFCSSNFTLDLSIGWPEKQCKREGSSQRQYIFGGHDRKTERGLRKNSRRAGEREKAGKK